MFYNFNALKDRHFLHHETKKKLQVTFTLQVNLADHGYV
jgi:hypothetical protein